MVLSSCWSDDHLELHNMAETGCSGCVHWPVGSFSINKCHALHTLPNTRIWFTHSLHVQQVSARWHRGVSRTCARTKTRGIPRDMMHSHRSYIIVCKQGQSCLMVVLYVTLAVIILRILAHFEPLCSINHLFREACD